MFSEQASDTLPDTWLVIVWTMTRWALQHIESEAHLFEPFNFAPLSATCLSTTRALPVVPLILRDGLDEPCQICTSEAVRLMPLISIIVYEHGSCGRAGYGAASVFQLFQWPISSLTRGIGSKYLLCTQQLTGNTHQACAVGCRGDSRHLLPIPLVRRQFGQNSSCITANKVWKQFTACDRHGSNK